LIDGGMPPSIKERTQTKKRKRLPIKNKLPRLLSPRLR
jgi:hypothetical protein